MENKKVKTVLIYFIVILLGSNFISCKKYLDAKPDSTLTTPTTLIALQAILDQAQYMNNCSPTFDEASADDYFLPIDRYNAISALSQEAYVWNTLNHSDYKFENDWSNLYNVIYNSNLCLEQLQKIESNTQNQISWDNIKGSSLFFRARSFMHLVWIFSKAYDNGTAAQDLGIPLRLTSDFNVPSIRAQLKETYERIILDFKESIQYLPDLSEHVLRPSKAAAYGFLARTYLSMRKYDSAFKYSDLCLQIKNDLIDYNDANLVNINSTQPFSEFNPEVIHHYITKFSFIRNVLNSYARIDSNLYQSYSGDDIRKTAFFQSAIGGQMFKGTYAGKYTPSLFSGIATDEMYLTRAECHVRANPARIDEALEDLNTLLEKRWETGTFVPFTGLTQPQALEIILQERRKELLMRGLRWMDIKRLNKDGANISITRVINGQIYTLSPNDNRFVLPLPTDIVNLTGMKQNLQ